MLASVLIDRCAEIAQDTGKVTWTSAQWVSWASAAQHAVVLSRPDAYQTSGAISLVPGIVQTIPTALRIFDVLYNCDDTGEANGRSLRLVQREKKDAVSPSWPTSKAGSVVREWMYDDRTPDKFLCWPPVHDYVGTPTLAHPYVYGTWATSPPDISSSGDTVKLKDVYTPPMQALMLYWAFSRDSRNTPNMDRARTFLAEASGFLGTKIKIDQAVSPKTREQLK